MKDKPIEESIVELMKTCGFGTVVLPVSPVSGGLMHRMYKVTTDCGIFAVKHLNPEIMKRPDARDNYDRAEKSNPFWKKRGFPLYPPWPLTAAKCKTREETFFTFLTGSKGVSPTGIIFPMTSAEQPEAFLEGCMPFSLRISPVRSLRYAKSTGTGMSEGQKNKKVRLPRFWLTTSASLLMP